MDEFITKILGVKSFIHLNIMLASLSLTIDSKGN